MILRRVKKKIMVSELLALPSETWLQTPDLENPQQIEIMEIGPDGLCQYIARGPCVAEHE